MKHDKVYVRIAEDDNIGTASIEQRSFTEEYIRKDALLEWIKAQLKENAKWREADPDEWLFKGKEVAMQTIIDKIETL